ncbi:MAG: serine/threonine-protein kinase [Verrucomicrobiota bacterium]
MPNDPPGRLMDGLDPQQLLAEGMAERNDPAPEVAGFELRGKLGEGGMGAVYRAWQASLGREVALKLVRPEFEAQESVFERLEREARAMAQLKHPNIVAIHDFARLEDDGAAIVMELVEGETLRTLLSRHPDGMPISKAMKIAHQIGAALETAHDAGLVHRDVKPENVLIDLEGNAHVADFGLALPIDEDATRLTRSGTTVGTLAYVAPEQLEGEAVDARADLFSFAVVIYEMLTGIRPRGVVEPPQDLRKEIAPGFGDALLRAMRRRPDERFKTVRAFLGALHKGHKNRRTRGSKGRRQRNAASRRQLLWVGGGVLATAALGGAGAFLFANRPGGWTELLPQVDPNTSIKGKWSRVPEGIRADEKAILQLPVDSSKLGLSYDVLFRVRQLEYVRGFALMFQHNFGFGALEFNVWGNRGLAGFQKINGKPLMESGHGVQLQTDLDVSYDYRLEVRSDRVRFFDDQLLKEYVFKPSDEFMLAWPWPHDQPRVGLAIGNEEAPTIFERVAWRTADKS